MDNKRWSRLHDRKEELEISIRDMEAELESQRQELEEVMDELEGFNG